MELFTANEIWPSFSQKLPNELKLSRLCNSLTHWSLLQWGCSFIAFIPIADLRQTCCMLQKMLYCLHCLMRTLPLTQTHRATHGGGKINKREKKMRGKNKKRKVNVPALSNAAAPLALSLFTSSLAMSAGVWAGLFSCACSLMFLEKDS